MIAIILRVGQVQAAGQGEGLLRVAVLSSDLGGEPLEPGI